jgi:hypothetical protein
MEFCRITKSAIPYWGRYPVPLAQNQVVAEVGIDQELRDAFLSLYGKLDKLLYGKIRDGWESGIGVSSGPKYDSKYDDNERKREIGEMTKEYLAG